MSSALGLFLQFNCLRIRDIYLVFLGCEVCQKYQAMTGRSACPLLKWFLVCECISRSLWYSVTYYLHSKPKRKKKEPKLSLQSNDYFLFVLDKDLDKLLSLLTSPEKQTGWTEVCRKQFCKVMKARPDIISGTGEYDLPG